MSSDTGLVFLSVSGHVPEPYCGEAGAGEVERGDVRVAVLRQHVVNIF